MVLISKSDPTQMPNDDGNGSVFVCEFCGIRTSSESVLAEHRKIIHKIPTTWTCPHCDYTTKHKFLINRHINHHMENRNFMCEVCGSSFHLLSSLKDHYNFIHSDERNYKCDLCPKTFKNGSTLSRHKKTHSEKRPYKCHCGTDYKRLSHLKRHMLNAHNESVKSRTVRKIPTESNVQLEKPLASDINKNNQTIENNSYSTLDSACLDIGEKQNDLMSSTLITPKSREEQDMLLSNSNNIILMSDNGVPASEQNHLITVNESQIIHLIPSFQFSPASSSSLRPVSLVTTEDMHNISLATNSTYCSPNATNQIMVDSFNLPEGNSSMIMVPSQSSNSDMDRHLDPLQNAPILVDRETDDTLARAVDDCFLVDGSDKKGDENVVVELTALRENHDELDSDNLDNLDYVGKPSHITNELPTAHYLTQSISTPSLAPDLLHDNFNII